MDCRALPNNIAERVGNWFLGEDFSYFVEELSEHLLVADISRNPNQTSAPPPIDVIVQRPARSMWQDVNVNSH